MWQVHSAYVCVRVRVSGVVFINQASTLSPSEVCMWVGGSNERRRYRARSTHAMRWPMGHASKPYVHSLVLGLIIIINATINITCILADTPAPAEGEQSATATTSSGNNDHTPAVVRSGNKKFSDPCESTEECGFADSVCDTSKKICLCVPEAPITNHIDKCGKAAAINESCFFNEQCEATMVKTECKDNRCVCRFELTPNFKSDGTVDCIGTRRFKYFDQSIWLLKHAWLILELLYLLTQLVRSYVTCIYATLQYSLSICI